MTEKLSIVIPTYKREGVLIDTISVLLQQSDFIDDIIIVDQTEAHEAGTAARLKEWEELSRIRWIRLKRPSVPAAMNKGLLAALSEVVLFLDDDICPGKDLVKNHLSAYTDDGMIFSVVGKVVQPEGEKVWGDFRFDSEEECYVENVMAGNLSVLRRKAIEAGGFDENFIGAAYNFETEFAERIIRSGGKIKYEPKAAIDHLRASIGGVRTYGDGRLTLSPKHAVGAYYYILVSQKVKNKPKACFGRLIRSVYSRQHLKKPWWIFLTAGAEVAGFFCAILLKMKGQRFLHSGEISGDSV